MFPTLSESVRQYILVTANYWAFTLTDGALRMLVILHFHQLGFSPLDIASLFVFYEFFGVVTNLIGGWLGARVGLNRTMNLGLLLQIIALSMLLAPSDWLLVPWVMAAQALSGIAKDLNKMSAKSAIKTLVKDDVPGRLYAWVAFLTGSKNTLKGVGFFLGGLLLALFEFRGAVLSMALVLVLVWLFSVVKLKGDLGRAKKYKPKFTSLFSSSRPVNVLSAARFFLFGARDIWFVIALPIYLANTFSLPHELIGGYLAGWVIIYGLIQGIAPKLTGVGLHKRIARVTSVWAFVLAAVPALLAVLVQSWSGHLYVVVIGLLVFAVVLAVNSSLHSYLIVQFARADGVSMDVGFYYMANAGGRLIGTVLSGWLFQVYGFTACLWVSTAFLGCASLISLALPSQAEK